MPLHYSNLQNPLLQAIVFLLLMIPVIFIARPKNIDSVYTVAGIIYALFIIVNITLYFVSNDVWIYFFLSLLASFGVMGLGYLIVVFFTRYIFKYDGGHESSMIFLIIIYHPPALLLAILLKWIFFKFW
jgi:hypothetical protein